MISFTNLQTATTAHSHLSALLRPPRSCFVSVLHQTDTFSFFCCKQLKNSFGHREKSLQHFDWKYSVVLIRVISSRVLRDIWLRRLLLINVTVLNKRSTVAPLTDMTVHILPTRQSSHRRDQIVAFVGHEPKKIRYRLE